jgi:hypothetical protein
MIISKVSISGFKGRVRFLTMLIIEKANNSGLKGKSQSQYSLLPERTLRTGVWIMMGV